MSDQSVSFGATRLEFVQIGILVHDLDRTVQALGEVFGIGPFQQIVYPPDDRPEIALEYRGQPARFCHRLAFARLGPIELEIIQPLEGQSGLTEFLDRHGEGIHHIRFNTADLPAALAHAAGHGLQPLMNGGGLRPGTHWVHLDTERLLGFIVEIMNVLPNTDGRTPQIVGGKVVG